MSSLSQTDGLLNSMYTILINPEIENNFVKGFFLNKETVTVFFSTEENLLHQVRVDGNVFLVVDAIRTAEILEKRDAVLSAEIHEFHVLDSAVKEHA